MKREKENKNAHCAENCIVYISKLCFDFKCVINYYYIIEVIRLNTFTFEV